MGHRHVFNASQMFEIDNDQSWNQTEQPYVHLGGAVSAENSSLVYPVENMSIDGAHFPSHWNPAPRSNVYSSSTHYVEMPHYPQEALAPSRDPFLHPSASGSFCMVPENYGHHHASSSNFGGQTFQGAEGGFFDLTMGNGRSPYKRKSPSVPAACEMGSTSRYHDAGSSSNLSMSSDIWQQEKPNADLHHTPLNYPSVTPSYRSGNSLSIGGEGSLRNVRSRAALDLEANLARTHLSNNPSHHSYTTSRPADHSSSMDLLSHSSNTHDTNVFSHETNHFIIGSSNRSASLEIGGYNNNSVASRNHVSQNLQPTSTQPVRGVRSSYTQRSSSTFRVGASSSSNLHLGHAANSDEGLQLVTENYSSRHPRPFSNTGWRNNDRSGRARISNERYRPLSDEAGVRDRLASEGLMLVDRSALYGSRNLFDQHRDMRLDVDNMSYEELLALGERIGDVNTGLSQDLISKCLMESIYCSSDQIQEEGTCVICLEEYKNMDDVGMLKACRHDFHVGCIRKWLSLKNLCPICKSCALADHVKEK